MSTVAAVEKIAPEFVGDARVQGFIDDAVILHNSEYWGLGYSQAIALFVAHMLTVLPATAAAAAGLSGGMIGSINTGGMSVGYNNPSRRYIWIRDTRVSASPLFVTI